MITYPITLPATPGPVTMEWSALTVGGRNVSPYTLGQETFEWPGNRWRVSLQYPRMSRADADALIAALLSLGAQGTFLLGPAGAGKTPKGTAGGSPIVSGAGQVGKSLLISGLTGILKAGDYFGIGGENRLFYSQAFDNAAWAKTQINAVTADTIVAPDGTTTAEALVSTGVGGNSYINQQNIPVKTGQPYTFSIFLRVPTGTKTIAVLLGEQGYAASSAYTVQPVNLTTAWQRFSVTRTMLASQAEVQIGGAGTTWTAGEIDAWAAQVNLGAAADLDYFPTNDTLQASIVRLYMNLADISGDPCTLDIFPRLRESPLVSGVSNPVGNLKLTNPQGLFRLAGNESKWDVDAANLYGLSFEAEEAF